MAQDEARAMAEGKEQNTEAMTWQDIQNRDARIMQWRKTMPPKPIEFNFHQMGRPTSGPEWIRAYNDYYDFVDKYPESTQKTWEELQFGERLQLVGFAPERGDYRPQDNWFGVSVYEPVKVLNCGIRTVWLALGGHGASMFSQHTTTIAHDHSKLIGMIKGNNVVYATFDGIVPDEVTLRKFLFE